MSTAGNVTIVPLGMPPVIVPIALRREFGDAIARCDRVYQSAQRLRREVLDMNDRALAIRREIRTMERDLSYFDEPGNAQRLQRDKELQAQVAAHQEHLASLKELKAQVERDRDAASEEAAQAIRLSTACIEELARRIPPGTLGHAGQPASAHIIREVFKWL